MGMKRWLLFSLISGLFLMSWSGAAAQVAKSSGEKEGKKAILPGAYNMDEYLPLLKDKQVALVINQMLRRLWFRSTASGERRTQEHM